MSDINAYLSALSKPQQTKLEWVRRVTKQVVPDAEEVMSYGMPAFRYHNRILIYYAAHTHHIGIYPASDGMVKAVGPKLAKFRTSKGTLQFAPDNPMPESLLRQVVEYRQRAIDGLLSKHSS